MNSSCKLASFQKNDIERFCCLAKLHSFSLILRICIWSFWVHCCEQWPNFGQTDWGYEQWWVLILISAQHLHNNSYRYPRAKLKKSHFGTSYHCNSIRYLCGIWTNLYNKAFFYLCTVSRFHLFVLFRQKLLVQTFFSSTRFRIHRWQIGV